MTVAAVYRNLAFSIIVLLGIYAIANTFLTDTSTFSLGYGKSLSTRSCSPGPKYVNHMTPRQLAFSNRGKPASVPPYFDADVLKGCSVDGDRKELYFLLQWWIEFAANNSIVWWISDGSLIGALRHGDIIPWDTDIDLKVMSQHETLLRDLSTPRGEQQQFNNSQLVKIVSRLGSHCHTNRDRLDCHGNLVTSLTDACAFCSPLARVFRRLGERIDLFIARIEINGTGDLVIFDEARAEYPAERYLYPIEWVFPLRNCTYMGLNVNCPQESDKLLTNIFGNYRRLLYKCIDKVWK